MNDKHHGYSSKNTEWIEKYGWIVQTIVSSIALIVAVTTLLLTQ